MCTMDAFTLPHISNILNRIGSTNPAWFGVMDFTQGFYQALLEDASRRLTAFWTHLGIFEWTRVPMGIKGAPTYFQRVMATQVLD